MVLGRSIVVRRTLFWFVVFMAFLLWFLVIFCYSKFTPASLVTSPDKTARQRSFALLHDEGKSVIVARQNDTVNDDPCSGRYVYIHHIPEKFNAWLLNDCRSLSNWTDMCQLTSNHGFGPRLGGSGPGWYATDQFSLEVIFHERMRNTYACLTNDSLLASAVFVPYYAGLDVARRLWGGHSAAARDADSTELARWLRARPEWGRLSGHDHFAVAGRVTWDFWRLRDPGWGNRFLLLPEMRNMMVLTIESSPWSRNDFAVPYPTSFHPSFASEVRTWQDRVRRRWRKVLFSFAGAPRPGDSIRGEVIGQCRRAGRRCRLLGCGGPRSGPGKCRNPGLVTAAFQSSVFCLQPPGDSTTRRSAFDSIVAGCVPVFFHPGSAYVQYLWHLPRDYERYSVFVPEEGVRNGTVSIERTLMGIGRKRVKAMREEVVRLIPRVVYATSKLEGIEDAFDVAVDAVLNRVGKIRREMEEGGGGLGFDYGEELSWKYNFFGNVEANEWDPYFYRS